MPTPGTQGKECSRGRAAVLAFVLLLLLPWPVRAADSSPDTAVPAIQVPGQRDQHLAGLGATAWQRAGHRGQGVKVAILDSGFRGYCSFLGKELPAKVLAHSFRSDGDLESRDSQHGILCAEVVHAVAPDAELLLANWEPERPDHFLDAVQWARQQGARVVSCSLIMPTWSDGEGGGPIHEALTKLLEP